MTMPPALAEHRAHLQQTLDDCCREVDILAESLNTACANRDAVLAEIRGVDKTLELPGANKPAVVAKRQRRNIKELAAAEIAQTPGWPGMSRDERVRYLCKQLRCKPSQAEAALRARADGRAE